MMMMMIRMCIKVDQLDAQILIMCLYLSLSALHVSDSLVHHQERRFGAVYRNWYMPVYAGICRYVWLLCGYSHTTARRMVPAYTDIYQMRCTAYKSCS